MQVKAFVLGQEAATAAQAVLQQDHGKVEKTC